MAEPRDDSAIWKRDIMSHEGCQLALFWITCLGYVIDAWEKPRAGFSGGFPWMLAWLGLVSFPLIGLALRHQGKRP